MAGRAVPGYADGLRPVMGVATEARLAPLIRVAAAGHLLPILARHGFVLVRAEGGLGYVEASDLLGQIEAAAGPSVAPRSRQSTGSGALGQRDRGDHDGDPARREGRKRDRPRRATTFGAEPQQNLADGGVHRERDDEDRPREE